MIVDYETAWIELLDLVASRDGWGSKTLTLEAARIAASNRVPENLVERVMRLYGPDVTTTPEGKSIPAPGGTPTVERIDAPTNEARGGHDGHADPQHHEQDHGRRAA